MSCTGNHAVSAHGVRLDGKGTGVVAATLVNGLCFAAAPTFAIMAVLTSVNGNADMVCTAMQSPFGGMAPMYALMSAFHAGPWLKLLFRRR